jgi:hypothetical protein
MSRLWDWLQSERYTAMELLASVWWALGLGFVVGFVSYKSTEASGQPATPRVEVVESPATRS